MKPTTTATPGLIVNDARKAMSLLSAAFYGYPQNDTVNTGAVTTKLHQALINLRRQGGR